MERRSLVGGWDVHEVGGLGLVVQVVHSGNQAGAYVHLKLAVWAGYEGVGDGSTITWTAREEKGVISKKNNL